MRDFNNRGRSGGPRRSFNDRGSDRPQMHHATCSNCGKDCEVPFRPNGSKPVLCSDCFKNGGNGDFRRNESRNFGRSNNEDRPMYDAVCSNCGNACQIPFQPRDGRPVFCSRCFEKNEGSDSRRPEERKPNTDRPNYQAQFDALNGKLDAILALLQKSPVQEEAKPLESIIDESVIDEIAEEIEEQKEVKVKAVKAKAAPKKTKKTTKK